MWPSERFSGFGERQSAPLGWLASLLSSVPLPGDCHRNDTHDYERDANNDRKSNRERCSIAGPYGLF
jgi:hypothetical protein